VRLVRDYSGLPEERVQAAAQVVHGLLVQVPVLLVRLLHVLDEICNAIRNAMTPANERASWTRSTQI